MTRLHSRYFRDGQRVAAAVDVTYLPTVGVGPMTIAAGSVGVVVRRQRDRATYVVKWDEVAGWELETFAGHLIARPSVVLLFSYPGGAFRALAEKGHAAAAAGLPDLHRHGRDLTAGRSNHVGCAVSGLQGNGSTVVTKGEVKALLERAALAVERANRAHEAMIGIAVELAAALRTTTVLVDELALELHKARQQNQARR